MDPGARNDNRRPFTVRAGHRAGATVVVDHADVRRGTKVCGEEAAEEVRVDQPGRELRRAQRLNFVDHFKELRVCWNALRADLRQPREGQYQQHATGRGRWVGQDRALAVLGRNRLARNHLVGGKVG